MRLLRLLYRFVYHDSLGASLSLLLVAALGLLVFDALFTVLLWVFPGYPALTCALALFVTCALYASGLCLAIIDRDKNAGKSVRN